MKKGFRKYVDVKCAECGIDLKKRDDTLKKWTGYCHSCACRKSMTTERRAEISQNLTGKFVIGNRIGWNMPPLMPKPNCIDCGKQLNIRGTRRLTQKRCNNCKHIHWGKEMTKSKPVAVSCKGCGFEYKKRPDGLGKWIGYCKKCIHKYVPESYETKQKRIKALTGRKLSPEVIEKMRVFRTGRPLSDETRTKIGNTHREKGISVGRPNPRKGTGKGSIHKKFRDSKEYQAWRTLVFTRDNYTCQHCGVRSGNGKRVELNADHIKPYCLFPELKLDVENGRTLCKPCHCKTPTFGKSSKQMLPLFPELYLRIA